MLCIGRSIGETAAVIFTAGSALRMPTSLFSSTRTMSVHFYILAREGISTPNAYGTAAVLILAILGINLVAYELMNRFIRKIFVKRQSRRHRGPGIQPVLRRRPKDL